jgi:phosphoribosyl-AMP cyclohydrolase
MNSLEETSELRPDFNKLAGLSGVLPVAVQNINTGEVILLAYTNQEAFFMALRKRSLILWSTSRNALWEKGSTSGETFELAEAYINCEQNSLLYRVRPRRGGICHTRNKAGQPRNCFYRRINPDTLRLENIDP